MATSGDYRSWLDPYLSSIEGAPPVKPYNLPGIEENKFSATEERKQLSADEEDISLLTVDKAMFLRFSWVGEVVYWLLCLASGGLFWLLTRWVRSIEAVIRYRRVHSNDLLADHVLAFSIDRYQEICPIVSIDPSSGRPDWVPVSRARMVANATPSQPFPFPRLFEWRHERFWFDVASGKWIRLQFATNRSFNDLHDMAAKIAFRSWDEMKSAEISIGAPMGNIYRGTMAWDEYTRRLTFGDNVIDIEPKPFFALLKDEALKPFFIFQIFSLVVWFFQEYYLYTYMVLSLSVISLCSTALVTWNNQRSLQKIAKTEVPVTRLFLSNKESSQTMSPEVLYRTRPGKATEKTRPWAPIPTFRRQVVTSSQLLPGDLIEITNETIIPCDMILLSGSIVINEAMLTGESAPVQKAPVPYTLAQSSVVDPSSWFRLGSDRDSKYVLFSGTKVVQAKPQASLSCNLVAKYNPAGNGSYTYAPPETVWQFSMDQAIASYRSHLKIINTPESEIDRRVQVFADSFRNREKALPVMGMVIKTGFNTAKGKLIRAILYPKPSKFDFDKQMLKFMVILISATLCGCLATVGFYQERNESGLKTLLSCLNIITVAIPPALPLALSVSLSTTFVELQTKKIYCINPNRIVPAGRVNTLCFDKTGTLTEDGLTLKGIHTLTSETLLDIPHDGNPRSKDMLRDVTMSISENKLVEVYEKVANNPLKNDIFRKKDHLTKNILLSSSRAGISNVVAACHSLAVLEEDDVEDEDLSVTVDEGQDEPINKGEEAKPSEYKEQFVGDPLEVQMFIQSGWRFDTRTSIPRKIGMFGAHVWNDPNFPTGVDAVMIPPEVEGADEALAILRRFDFDSTLRRMSSVVYHSPLTADTTADIHFSTLVKGAPESLRELCHEFSIPNDYDTVLHSLTMAGYRVLACAYRPFTASEIIGAGAESMSKPELMDAAYKLISSSHRSEMEKNLFFAGLLVMENSLKAPTVHYLEQYTRAGLRCIMVTGDNPMTAAAVAKQCDPFFLRPSRRTVLLDFVKEPGQEGKLVLKDILNPTAFADFFKFLRERNQNATFKMNAANELHLVDDYAESIPAELSADLDLVVTGTAFQKLQLTHEEYIKEQQEIARLAGKKFDRNANIHFTPYHIVLNRANIFARMSPQNKQELMTSLQDISLVVAMTGDGANDSGALKSADVGLSIRANDVEDKDVAASSAPTIAAPFSTSYSHIGALSILLTEGRACLVSSFAMFRFMFCYGVIQFTSVLILYRLVLELHNNQYLWSDLFLVFPLAIFMPMIKAKPTLSRGRPESDLFSPSILRSVFGLGAILVAFQIATNEYFHTTDGYVEPTSETDTLVNLDTSESFSFASFQYTAVGIAVSQNFGVFRQPLYKSYMLCLVFATQFALNSIMLLGPTKPLEDYFKIVPPEKETRWEIFIIAVANSICFILYERFCVPHQSPDEEPFDVEGVVKEIKPRADSNLPVPKQDKPDYQPTILPKLRWTTPQYTIIQSVTSPIWSALSTSK